MRFIDDLSCRAAARECRARRALWMRLAIAGILGCGSAVAEPKVELITNRLVVDDIYESIYSVRTGNGEFDRIQLHRVTRQQGAEAVSSGKALLLVHGDVWGFNAAFLPLNSGRDSLPAYLAGRGVDVWGVDLAWALVPEATSDFGFMRDWGMQHDIDDIDAALEAAEKIRKDHSRFTVLGWSRGAWLLYGLLNQEAQKPCARRRVKAAIPFDGSLKFNDPAAVALACGQAAVLDSALGAGQFASDFRIWSALGTLAEQQPADASPLLGPPFTNRQALLQIGAAGFALFGPGFTPQYHFVAGVFPNDDLTKIPTDLQYTDEARFTKFAKAASPYMPTRMLRDSYQVSCQNGPAGPFDNSLAAVEVPVLYVGARGGFGDSGLATVNLLSSTSEETLLVSLRPHDAQGLDFGHVDLVHARDAQQLVWSGIDVWLTKHANDPVCRGR